MKYIMLAVITITALFIYGNYRFKIKEIIVVSPKIPKSFDGFRILHLSDLHNASYGDGNERLIKAINKENPDAIFYTGDMTDELNFKNNTLYPLIKGINRMIPAYYVFGNHEDSLLSHEKVELIETLEKVGIKILRNERIVISKNQEEIYLYGLHSGGDYLRDTYTENGDLKLSKESLEVYLGPPRQGYNILLAHNPLYGDTYMDAGYDLTLSGHVHGGMIRIPFLGGVFSPDRSFFPKYSKGKYLNSNKVLIVSPGIGGHKARIANPPTIYRIILKTQSHHKTT